MSHVKHFCITKYNERKKNQILNNEFFNEIMIKIVLAINVCKIVQFFLKILLLLPFPKLFRMMR